MNTKVHRIYPGDIKFTELLPKKHFWVSPHFCTKHASVRKVRYEKIPNCVLVCPENIRAIEYIENDVEGNILAKKYTVEKIYAFHRFKFVVCAKNLQVITFLSV